MGIYGLAIIIQNNINMFCNVRFSVVKVFEIDAGVIFDPLVHGFS